MYFCNFFFVCLNKRWQKWTSNVHMVHPTIFCYSWKEKKIGVIRRATTEFVGNPTGLLPLLEPLRGKLELEISL